MPKRYAREFRRAICDRLVAGERISKVSSETDVSQATPSSLEDQALIDAGLKEGTKSVEVDELAQACACRECHPGPFLEKCGTVTSSSPPGSRDRLQDEIGSFHLGHVASCR